MEVINLPEEAVFAQGNHLLTDSRMVAKVFGRAHRHVLRDIDELVRKVPQFACAHFWAHVENRQIGVANRDIRSYRMSKDGLILLVMGFKGQKAFSVKLAYIEAFNRMQDRITGLNNELLEKLTAALEAEKQSFALASLAGRIMRRRKDEKPEFRQQIAAFKSELQPLLNNFISH